MSPTTKERLEELQTRTDADSMAEVVRHALAFYDHMVSVYEKRGRLEVFDAEGHRVGSLTLPSHMGNPGVVQDQPE